VGFDLVQQVDIALGSRSGGLFGGGGEVGEEVFECDHSGGKEDGGEGVE
jgi:hypothetical protein